MGRKVWMIGMVALLTVTVGCSSDNSNNTGGDATVNGGSENTGKGNAPGDGEAVTYTIGRNLNPNDVNVVKLQEATGETLEDNRWTKLFEEELNISIDYKITAPNSDNYNQSLKLAMASSDLPDIFQVSQPSDLKQLISAGAIEEMGPLYEEYGSDLLKSILESETKQVFEPAMSNGKMYAVPMKMPSTNGYNHLWIREDWLTKLGLDRPKTIDDMYNIAKAFVEQDPDRNGKADTLGLELDSDFRFNTAGLFWGFGAIPNPSFWIEKDGQVARSIVQPEMKKPLALLNKMYNEGLIDKEFGIKDQNKAMESVVSGKTGMFYGAHWMAFTVEKTLANDPNAKWITVPLPTETGDPIAIPLTNSVDGYMVVKKGTPHPENLIKLMNLHSEKLFGESAEFNKYFGEGGLEGIWSMSPVYTLDPMLDLRGHQEIKKAIADGTTDSLTGTAQGFYKSMQDGSWSISMMFGPKDTPFELVNMTYPDQVIWNAYTGAPTPTEVTRGSSMDELLETQLTAMILGKTDTDSGFDKMVADWKALGGEAVTKEVSEALSK